MDAKTALSTLPVLLLALPLSPGVAADASCPPASDHVWFVGAVYDSEERADFKQDVLNFEFFLDELRDVYCIPDSQAEILAFDGAWTYGATSYSGYTPATEDNVKDTLISFAADANDHSDSILFFFLSSHGLVYTTGLSSCPLGRLYGSYSVLDDGGGQDGFLDDCELGSVLTSYYDSDVRMYVAVDCSFCGGFSDSLTAASGTVPDGAAIVSSRVPGPNRVVVTGCAMTTECFGGGVFGGAVFYDNLRQVINNGPASCDGWTAPGFPTVQGFDVPVKNTLLRPQDGTCTASEWFFAAVNEAYLSPIQPIGIQEQFRIKYGSGLSADFQVMA